MGQRRDQLRRALGDTLRGLRQAGQFSLDEIQRQTAEVGVRVTRSHLSRVETGQAELTLPRFLALLRALGENGVPVLERLEALLEPVESREELLSRAVASRRRGDPHTAARLYRCLFAQEDPEGLAEHATAWLGAEAGLGRWEAAERVLRRLALPWGSNPAPLLLALAVAGLGRAHPSLALALAEGAARERLAQAVAAACWLASGNPRRADELAGAADSGSPATLVVAEARRQSGFARAAAQAALKAAEQARSGAERAEAWLVLARTQGDLRRPAAGLAALAKAIPLARESGLPELLARCHAEAHRLWKQDGQMAEARLAARSSRALITRCGADRRTPRFLPLQALFGAALSLWDPSLQPEQSGQIAHALQAGVGGEPQPDHGDPGGAAGGGVESGVADQHGLFRPGAQTLQGENHQIGGRLAPGHFVPAGQGGDP